MDDFERYGDYNEVDEPPSSGKALLIIKIVAAVICVAVIAIIGLRLFTFNYYPKSMRTLVFTPALTEHYNATGGDIGALTQNLRAPYDDAKLGNFFASNLVVIKDIGELQITLRYNTSLKDTLATEYKLPDFDVNGKEAFTFRLWRDSTEGNEDGFEVGTLTVADFDSYAMYRYFRLVFDGIDFSKDEGEDKIEWLRLEIFIDGIKEPFMIPVYENNSDHSLFAEYELSGGERP